MDRLLSLPLHAPLCLLTVKDIPLDASGIYTSIYIRFCRSSSVHRAHGLALCQHPQYCVVFLSLLSVVASRALRMITESFYLWNLFPVHYSFLTQGKHPMFILAFVDCML